MDIKFSFKRIFPHYFRLLGTLLFAMYFWGCGEDTYHVDLTAKDARTGEQLPYVIPKLINLIELDSLNLAFTVPQLNTDRVLCGQFELGNSGRALFFLLYKSNTRSIYYDRLLLDQNNDRDFTNDDTIYKTTGQYISARTRHYVEFDSLLLPYQFVTAENVSVEQVFGRLYFWQDRSELPSSATFLRQSWREGTFQFDEQQVEVMLIDDDNNGIFDANDNWTIFVEDSLDPVELHFDDFRSTTNYSWLEQIAFEIVKIDSNGYFLELQRRMPEFSKDEDIGRDNPYLDEPHRPRAARNIRWLENWTAAKNRAHSRKKPILLMFQTSWSGPSQKMQERTFSDAQIVSLTDNFVCVSLDADKQQRLVEEFGITNFPTTVVLNYRAQEMSRAIGYQPASEFSAYLAQYAEKP